jgi:hypothetical protein
VSIRSDVIQRPNFHFFTFGVLAELIVPVYFCPHLCFVETQVGRGDGRDVRGYVCREAVTSPELPLDELPSLSTRREDYQSFANVSASASFVVVVRRMAMSLLLMSLVGGKNANWPDLGDRMIRGRFRGAQHLRGLNILSSSNSSLEPEQFQQLS